jgi:hypothetical protein
MARPPQLPQGQALVSPLKLVKTRLADRDLRIVGRMAQCPAHDDHEPSLSINEGEDGRALLHCHAGCELADVLDALDLDFHHLFATHTWPTWLRPHAPASSPSTSDPNLSPPPRCLNPGPSPGPGTAAGEEPELCALLRDHAAGEMHPVSIALELPESLPSDAVEVVRHMALCVGLRWAVAELRPLPYATSFCATHVPGVRNKGHASRLLRLLESAKVIRSAGRMPRRPGGPPDGTKTYELVLAPGVAVEVASADALEALDPLEVLEELVGVDPAIEGGDELAVEGAEVPVAPARAVGVVAAGDRAVSAIGCSIRHGDVHDTRPGGYQQRAAGDR